MKITIPGQMVFILKWPHPVRWWGSTRKSSTVYNFALRVKILWYMCQGQRSSKCSSYIIYRIALSFIMIYFVVLQMYRLEILSHTLNVNASHLVWSRLCQGFPRTPLSTLSKHMCGLVKITDTIGSLVSLGHYARSWCRHQMETFSALLAICAGNSPASDAELWCFLWFAPE